jgi:hypothetical protein
MLSIKTFFSWVGTMKNKSAWALGLETMLNNPETSFLKNPSGFQDMHKHAEMPLSSIIMHLGRTAKGRKTKPTDAERSEARLERMGGE